MNLDTKALFFTAYDRPEYLKTTLESWRNVRGFYDWPVYAMIEPSPRSQECADIFLELEHPNLQLSTNPRVYGVLHHPWVGFKRLFDRYNFVVRAEDDLIVSEDILEYFDWAQKHYRGSEDVAAVIGFTREDGPDDEVHKLPKFDPWIWGTWRNRWKGFMEETWDHDYSTNNGQPGVQAGWDWNLDTRLYPALGLKSIFPASSRVQNIGAYGTHAMPQDFAGSLSPSFRLDRAPVAYEEV